MKREDRGDDPLLTPRVITPRLDKNKQPEKQDLVHCCLNTIAQGDHLGVNLLVSEGLLCEPEDLTSRPFHGSDVLQGLVIDDFFSASIEPSSFASSTSKAYARFKTAERVYKKESLIGSPQKDVT